MHTGGDGLSTVPVIAGNAGVEKLICHYHAGSIMAVFTEAKTHGVRRICWPDNASRDLSGQHLYL